MAKAKSKSFYVMLQAPGRWDVTQGYSARPLSTHTTQRAAIEAARLLARAAQGDISIYKRNGNLLTREWYTPRALTPPPPPKVFMTSLGNKKREQAIIRAIREVMAEEALNGAHEASPKQKKAKKTLTAPT